jgi:hypothetical protein
MIILPYELSNLPAEYHGGTRPSSSIRFVCIHTSDGPSSSDPRGAQKVAQYFAHCDRQASAHYVIGCDDAYKCVSALQIAYAVPGLNTPGLHVELVALSTDSTNDWLAASHNQILDRAARLFALLCYTYDIRPDVVIDADLSAWQNNHVTGIVTHAQCSRVLKPNNGHTDPGPNFPLDKFLELVQTYYNS